MLHRGEEERWRWYRAEDGQRLTLTSKGRLLEAQPGCDWVQLRWQASHGEALIRALVHGFVWVASWPADAAPGPDPRCKVRVVRVRARGGQVCVAALAQCRERSPAVLPHELVGQPPEVLRARAALVEGHARRVAEDLALLREAAARQPRRGGQTRGRPRGEGHPGAKLTAREVAEMRQRHAAGGVTQVQLAREYGTHISNVRAILLGQTWREDATPPAGMEVCGVAERTEPPLGGHHPGLPGMAREGGDPQCSATVSRC